MLLRRTAIGAALIAAPFAFAAPAMAKPTTTVGCSNPCKPPESGQTTAVASSPSTASTGDSSSSAHRKPRGRRSPRPGRGRPRPPTLRGKGSSAAATARAHGRRQRRSDPGRRSGLAATRRARGRTPSTASPRHFRRSDSNPPPDNALPEPHARAGRSSLRIDTTNTALAANAVNCRLYRWLRTQLVECLTAPTTTCGFSGQQRH